MWPFKREKRATTIENPGVPISASNIMQLLGWDTTSAAGVNITPDTAMKVPAVFAAVNFLSNTMASLPVGLYKKGEDGRETLDKDPLYPLLHDSPNTEWTSFRWRQYSFNQTLLRGRQYSYIQRGNNGKVQALWPLRPTLVTPHKDGLQTLYRYRAPSGRTIDYRADEILDVPFMLEEDQCSFVVPVQRLRDAIGLGLVLQEYANKFFQNGGVPPLTLEGPFQSAGAIERAAGDMTKAVQRAAANGEQVLPIPGGHKLDKLGYNPTEGQMIEGRRFVIEDVARMYSLPPVFLQDLTHGTFSNTEQQDLNFVKHTLTQWVKAWEQECNLKLFRQPMGKYVEMNVDGLLRGDFKTRMEGYAKGIQNAVYTPNEPRTMENLPPKEGGNKIYLQQNMAGLEAIEDGGPDGN